MSDRCAEEILSRLALANELRSHQQSGIDWSVYPFWKDGSVVGEERQKTRILLADGHYIVRQGIRCIFEKEPDLEVVSEADNGEQAVRLARELKPDIIVMEVCLGKLDSVEATKRVKAQHPDAAVLVLTASDSFLWECLREHLAVEFPKFDENLSTWKAGVATIVEGCHNLTETIAGKFKERGTKVGWDSAKPYLSPDSKEYGPGVYYDLLASSIYECVIANQAPHFRRGYDSRELVIEGMKAIARGDDSLLDQVEQCCLDIVDKKTVKQKVKHLNLAKGEVESLQKSIKQDLRLVLERGTFEGTCSICIRLVDQSLHLS